MVTGAQAGHPAALTSVHPPLLPYSPADSHTFHIFHDHAEVAPGLKGAEHADHKWVLGEGKNVALHKSLLDLVAQDQVLFVDLFHREALPRVPVPHQIDGAAGGESEDRPSPPRHPAFATLPPLEPRVAHP